MTKKIYAGKGTYSETTTPGRFEGTYEVNLPSSYTYKFDTSNVYNFSSQNNENLILIFMEVDNATPDPDLTGYTTDPAVSISLHLSAGTVQDVAAGCIPLDFGKNITVCIRHDDTKDLPSAKADLYTGSLLKKKKGFELEDTETPRKHGFGTLQKA